MSEKDRQALHAFIEWVEAPSNSKRATPRRFWPALYRWRETVDGIAVLFGDRDWVIPKIKKALGLEVME